MTTTRTRVHAFGDDALGDHDAVGLAEEIRAGRVSRREAVEAAIARTRVLDEQLSGLAADRFAEAVAEAGSEHGGFFAGLPTFVKDNSDVAGLPTQQGTRRTSRSPPARRDFARMYGLIGTTTLGKTRLSEYGFSASAEFVDDAPGPQPVAHRPHLGSVLGRARRLRRCRRGADGARQRRWRLDPDPGGRATGWSA